MIRFMAGMSELDRVKDEIAYLKLWLGILVVTDISLIGWLVTAANNFSVGVFALAFSAAIALTLIIVGLHRRIDRRIYELGRL